MNQIVPRHLLLLLLLLLCGLLAACDTSERLGDMLYRSGSGIGNRYCETRDQALRDSAVARINQGLREEGATFTFHGIDCDAARASAPVAPAQPLPLPLPGSLPEVEAEAPESAG